MSDLQKMLRILMWAAVFGGATVAAVSQDAAQPSPQQSMGQRAVSVILSRYAVDPTVMVTKTGKPLPVDGAWSVGKETPASCPKTTDPCVQVFYRVPESEVLCEWVVLLKGGEDDSVIDENEDAARYLLAKLSEDAGKKLKISKQGPTYPPIARAAHVTGSVKMTVHITATGHVDKVAVASGPEMLRAAAVDAVSHWIYKPLIVGSTASPFQTVVTINFK